MKKSHLLLIAGSLTIAFASCGPKQKSTMEKSYLDLNNLDTAVSPKQDFYEYACGGWMKNNPLRDEHARFGSFDKLIENNQNQVKELIEDLSKKPQAEGSVGKKIGDLYALGMDTAKLEKQGIDPIKEELQAISNLKDKEEVLNYIAQQHKEGVFSFFNIYIAADEKNSKMNIVNFFQGGLGMPDRDYYLLNDANSVKIREAYSQHLEKMFSLAGFPAEAATKNAKSVMSLETAMAKISSTRQALRDPEANYNKMTVVQLQEMAPAIKWQNYFSTIGVKDLKDLNVAQKMFFKDLNKIIASTSVEDLKAYMAWNLIGTAASYLNNAMVQQNFEFYGKTLTGKKEMQPRWKRVVNTVDGVIGEGVGEMYVAKYFPAESKERMLNLVANLQEALKERIQTLDWMTDETKAKAIEKLSTFYVKIGYPNKWRDYSKLDINANDSYWANIKRSNIFDVDYMIGKAGKPVDKDEWLMNPQTVNAYYNPTTNEICFPAGILQPPFFFAKGDDALNYGAIGVVIGHEMTHGFDDQGRMYDKDGNLKDWWTTQDAENFKKRSQALIDYFNQQFVMDSVHADGQLTIGENIADQGGLILSYAALQKVLANKPVEKIDGFMPQQRFYIAYANVWAGNIRPEEILRLTKVDVHSLGRLRVDATLPHIQEFLEAFDIKEGDKMFLPKEKRALVW